MRLKKNKRENVVRLEVKSLEIVGKRPLKQFAALKTLIKNLANQRKLP